MRKMKIKRPKPGGGAGRRPFGLIPRRPVLVLSCSLTVAAVVAGIWHGGYIGAAAGAVDRSIERGLAAQGFAVHRISLSGEERTAPDTAYEALAIQPGDPMFAIKPDAARARLLELPWVGDAEVRRVFPDEVSVRLIEKRPFALWSSAGSLWVVERSGAIITSADRVAFPRLPLLLGEGAPDAAPPIVDAVRKQRAIEARLEVLERVGERRWDVHLAGGVVVRLPEQGWEGQLADLEMLIVEKGVLERDIDVIDLRYPDNYVFKLRNGDSRPVPRERRA
jgi:cell division protein FtsQ